MEIPYICCRLNDIVSDLREDLSNQSTLMDKEMLMHKAALVQLISASTPSPPHKHPKPSLSSLPSSPSSSSPAKSPRAKMTSLSSPSSSSGHSSTPLKSKNTKNSAVLYATTPHRSPSKLSGNITSSQLQLQQQNTATSFDLLSPILASERSQPISPIPTSSTPFSPLLPSDLTEHSTEHSQGRTTDIVLNPLGITSTSTSSSASPVPNSDRNIDRNNRSDENDSQVEVEVEDDDEFQTAREDITMIDNNIIGTQLQVEVQIIPSVSATTQSIQSTTMPPLLPLHLPLHIPLPPPGGPPPGPRLPPNIVSTGAAPYVSPLGSPRPPDHPPSLATISRRTSLNKDVLTSTISVQTEGGQLTLCYYLLLRCLYHLP